MLHPFIRPRVRDIFRRKQNPYPEHATSDEITRVAASNVERLHSEDDAAALDLWTVVIVLVGLLGASWGLGAW